MTNQREKMEQTTKQSTKPMRTLIAYCVLAEKLRTPGTGLLQALTPFFAEICRQFSGNLFDAAGFSGALAERFGIRMPRLAALGLAEQLAVEGLLTTLPGSTPVKVYRYATTLIASDAIDTSPLTENEIEGVISAFIDYCRTDDLLVAWDDLALESAFLDRLLNLDSMRLLGKRESSIAAKRTVETLVLSKKQLAPEVQYERDDLHLDFLVSQFLLDLKDNNPPGFERVSNIAFANMAAEAIACFREPPVAESSISDLTVYLDSPLLLDMLGVNAEYTDYGLELLEAIKASGATPAIFDHCIAEAESAIHAQLGYLRSGVNRLSSHWGTSAKPDLLGALANNVGARASQRLAIAVHPDPVINLHRISQPTVGDIETSMTARMQNWRNAEAKEYDRKSVWAMLSIRDGLEPSKRICESKWILLTRNTALVGIANDAWNTWITKTKKYGKSVAASWMPIAMSDKQFAGYLWVRSGGGDGSISKARLLAHCSAAVRPRADVKARVYNLVLELSGSRGAEDVVALIDDREGERALMRVTRGDPEDVTLDRIPFILEQVKLAAGEFAAAVVREESERQLEKVRTAHEEEVERLRNETESVRLEGLLTVRAAQLALTQKQMDHQALAKQLATVQQSLEEQSRTDASRKLAILQAGLSAGARRYRQYRWAIVISFSCAMGGAVLLSEGNVRAAAALTAALTFAGAWFVPEFLDKPLRNWAMSRLRAVVAMKDSSIEIPSQVPDFKKSTWEALNVLLSPQAE